MSKIAKDGKTDNITIRVTQETKEKAKKVWEKKYKDLPFNAFLGHMISVGLEEANNWIEINDLKNEKIKDEILRRTELLMKNNFKSQGVPSEYHTKPNINEVFDDKNNPTSALQSETTEKGEKLA